MLDCVAKRISTPRGCLLHGTTDRFKFSMALSRSDTIFHPMLSGDKTGFERPAMTLL